MTIEQVQKLCEERSIVWSVHAAEMMMRRGISRLDVLNCLQHGEIIEDYLSSFPNPSCLVFGLTLDGKVLHAVCCWFKRRYTDSCYCIFSEY